MFKIFEKGSNPKSQKKSSPRKKTYQEVLDKRLVKEAQSDSDWALQMALQKEGLKVETPTEKQHKKIAPPGLHFMLDRVLRNFVIY